MYEVIKRQIESREKERGRAKREYPQRVEEGLKLVRQSQAIR